MFTSHVRGRHHERLRSILQVVSRAQEQHTQGRHALRSVDKTVGLVLVVQLLALKNLVVDAHAFFTRHVTTHLLRLRLEIAHIVANFFVVLHASEVVNLAIALVQEVGNHVGVVTCHVRTMHLSFTRVLVCQVLDVDVVKHREHLADELAITIAVALAHAHRELVLKGVDRYEVDSVMRRTNATGEGFHDKARVLTLEFSLENVGSPLTFNEGHDVVVLVGAHFFDLLTKLGHASLVLGVEAMLGDAALVKLFEFVLCVNEFLRAGRHGVATTANQRHVRPVCVRTELRNTSHGVLALLNQLSFLFIRCAFDSIVKQLLRLFHHDVHLFREHLVVLSERVLHKVLCVLRQRFELLLDLSEFLVSHGVLPRFIAHPVRAVSPYSVKRGCF